MQSPLPSIMKFKNTCILTIQKTFYPYEKCRTYVNKTIFAGPWRHSLRSRSQELKQMLPEGVLSTAIMADFWQPQKNERKAELTNYWHQRAVLDRMNIQMSRIIGGSRIFLEGVTLGTRASEASEHWGSALTGEGFGSRRGTKRHRNNLCHTHNINNNTK